MGKFELSDKPRKPTLDQSLILVLFKDKVLFNQSNNSIFFAKKNLPLAGCQISSEFIYVGKLQENELYAISISSVEGTILFKEIDSLIDDLKDDEKSILFRALQLAQWNRTAQHCGCCGGKTHLSEEEFMRICGDCNHKIYPQYSPAILVLVSHGNQLLLGRSYHFKPGMYSVLAGFIEAGETAEAAVCREIREEAGIEIQNIHHHSTQPWPFPNSLMIAYTAEYKSGDLHFDKKELEDVRWFSTEKLPNLPMRSSIAYQLIDEFVKKNTIADAKRPFRRHNSLLACLTSGLTLKLFSKKIFESSLIITGQAVIQKFFERIMRSYTGDSLSHKYSLFSLGSAYFNGIITTAAHDYFRDSRPCFNSQKYLRLHREGLFTMSFLGVYPTVKQSLTEYVKSSALPIAAGTATAIVYSTLSLATALIDYGKKYPRENFIKTIKPTMSTIFLRAAITGIAGEVNLKMTQAMS